MTMRRTKSGQIHAHSKNAQYFNQHVDTVALYRVNVQSAIFALDNRRRKPELYQRCPRTGQALETTLAALKNLMTYLESIA